VLEGGLIYIYQLSFRLDVQAKLPVTLQG